MYPRISVNLKKIKENGKDILEFLEEKDIELIAVTKVFGADEKIVKALYDAGIRKFGDSRLENLENLKLDDIEKISLRLSMLSEVKKIIKTVDISLESELVTIKALNEVAKEYNKIHKIILMIDVGDLREGIWDYNEILCTVEEILEMENIKLIGLGTNLSCYGGVNPSKENMEKLKTIKLNLEKKFGIIIPIISGGNSSSLPIIRDIGSLDTNQIRLGESIAFGVESATRAQFLNLNTDIFFIEAEIIEVKKKPSIPIGNIGFNAFGEIPVFEDRGEKTRIIVALGRQDLNHKDIKTLDENLTILGSSSDHLILDIDTDKNKYKVGDIIKFSTVYRSVLNAFTSKYIKKVYK